MRHYCSLILMFLLVHETPARAAPASPLAIEVSCTPGPQCIYTGKGFYIHIAVVNRSDRDVLFTAKYLRRSGAYLILRDRTTKKEGHWHASLADVDLLGDFEVIRPGESVVINESVDPTSIDMFGKKMIDLDVEVTLDGNWKYVDGERVQFAQSGRFKIIGADTAALQNKRKQQ
jgi:hypothetical protein